MAIIYSYPQATVKPSDRILASDTTQTGNPTINITVGGIANYILTLLGFGSGTPGTMPVWVTDQQLGNSYIRQITSPPTPKRFATLFDKTPFDVERIEIPSPSKTRGS